MTKDDLHLSLSVLTDLLSDQTIESEFYYKMLVKVAFEFSVLKDLEQSRIIIQDLPSEYILEDLERQMVNDSEFRNQAYDLANSFVDYDIVTFSNKDSFKD